MTKNVVFRFGKERESSFRLDYCLIHVFIIFFQESNKIWAHGEIFWNKNSGNKCVQEMGS